VTQKRIFAPKNRNKSLKGVAVHLPVEYIEEVQYQSTTMDSEPVEASVDVVVVDEMEHVEEDERLGGEEEEYEVYSDEDGDYSEDEEESSEIEEEEEDLSQIEEEEEDEEEEEEDEEDEDDDEEILVVQEVVESINTTEDLTTVEEENNELKKSSMSAENLLRLQQLNNRYKDIPDSLKFRVVGRGRADVLSESEKEYINQGKSFHARKARRHRLRRWQEEMSEMSPGFQDVVNAMDASINAISDRQTKFFTKWTH